MVVAALPPRSSTGRRCRSGGAGAGVAVLCRSWWLQFGFGQPFRVPSWSEEPHIGRQCGRVAPPHATEVAFLGLLRHRTRVDVVQRCLFGVLQAVGIRRADGILVMTVAPCYAQ